MNFIFYLICTRNLKNNEKSFMQAFIPKNSTINIFRFVELCIAPCSMDDMMFSANILHQVILFNIRLPEYVSG